MEYKLNLLSKYFDKIKNNQKEYEVRLNNKDRKYIKPGDTIIFFEEPDHINFFKTLVTERKDFCSFSQLLDSISFEKIGFQGFTKQEIIDVYYSFYSLSDEKEYGVVAFKVEKI